MKISQQPVLPIGELGTAASASRHEPGHSWALRQLRLIDAAAIIVAILCAQLLRFGGLAGSSDLSVNSVQVPYWLVGVTLAVVWWVTLELKGAHNVRLLSNLSEAAREVISPTFLMMGLVAIASFALRIETARGYILIAFPVGMALLVAGRKLFEHVLVRRRELGIDCSRTVVLGRSVAAAHTLEHILRDPALQFHPVAMITPDRDGATSLERDGIRRHFGTQSPESVMKVLRQYQADAVIVTDESGLSPQDLRRLGWQLAEAHIRLLLAPNISGIAGPRLRVRPIAGLPLLHVSTPHLSSGAKAVKRCADIVSSGLLLALLSPLFLLLALLVRSDGSAAIYRQERVGLGAAPFGMLKFRSMVPNADQLRSSLVSDDPDSLLFKMRDDPRITKHGKWMRRYSLDELPQLVNVFRGDMSLVGPRPPLRNEVEQYGKDTTRRLLVKPGVTGLWQVSGRSSLTWEESVRLDLYYVENWSLVGDFSILLRTFKAVVGSDGAY